MTVFSLQTDYQSTPQYREYLLECPITHSISQNDLIIRKYLQPRAARRWSYLRARILLIRSDQLDIDWQSSARGRGREWGVDIGAEAQHLDTGSTDSTPRKEGRGYQDARSPTRSPERASASSRAARQDLGALSYLAAPEPPPSCEEVRFTRRREDCVRVPRLRSAREQLPGARIREAPSSQRAARRPPGCHCRRHGAAASASAPGRLQRLLSLPPPALWLRIGRGLSLSLSLASLLSCLLSALLASPPLPPISFCLPLAPYHKCGVKFQPPSPASWTSLAYRRAAPSSPKGDGAGKERGQARRRELQLQPEGS
ncbi:uncharacterized protein LOC124080324 [Marmota monax]|uniref:uncharacterized protein LOC124080324 n=1 Tax=Marmota monax TaxID=9995 RepID=UPI001EB05593|nr:uncharacterized protein LOC124080324 [Marmota monax]